MLRYPLLIAPYTQGGMLPRGFLHDGYLHYFRVLSSPPVPGRTWTQSHQVWLGSLAALDRFGSSWGSIRGNNIEVRAYVAFTYVPAWRGIDN